MCCVIIPLVPRIIPAIEYNNEKNIDNRKYSVRCDDMIEMICSEVRGYWVGGGQELVERAQIMNEQVCYACENKLSV